MVRLAILGAGIMGSQHARVAAAVRDADLLYVVDPDGARAETVARAVRAQAAQTVDDVVGKIDAAVVAVPTDLHTDVGLALVEAGVHVLVEKPLAGNLADAMKLVEAADDRGVILAVGHVERFNPAILELERLVGNPLHISAIRMSPFTTRIQDSVIFDLMVHDLDIIRSLVKSPVAEVRAISRRLRSTTADLASALLTFENGVTASLTASRVSHQKIRDVGLTQDDCYISLDLIKQTVTISRIEHSEFLSEEGARYRQAGVVEIPFLEHRGEPLFLEIQEFVSAVMEARAPRVTGEDGVEALRMAHRVADVASS